jgi:hypothetical protein
LVSPAGKMPIEWKSFSPMVINKSLVTVPGVMGVGVAVLVAVLEGVMVLDAVGEGVLWRVAVLRGILVEIRVLEGVVTRVRVG